jgi:hypothetical protein
MRNAIAPTARVAMTDAQVSAELTGETVILAMRDGQYYGLDRVGTLAWRLMREPTPFATIVDAVVERFDVERGRAAADLERLLRELEAIGVVSVDAPPTGHDAAR